MTPIYKNLYQFTDYIPPMDFAIHQYLLASDPAVMFAAGTMQQAERILPQVKDILQKRTLKYILVSHMESDECGGLPVFLNEYPDVTVVCSALCARELSGFGYQGKVITGDPEKFLCDGDLHLQLFTYPSEVHLQDGILCLEKNSGIFYTADLMLRFGNGSGKILQSAWKQEVDTIDSERIPSPQKLQETKDILSAVSPSFAAVGHGFCIECTR